MAESKKVKNLVDLSNVKTQLIDSSSKNYKSVFCTFKYGNEPIEKIVIIPTKEGASNNHYFSFAKEKLNAENKSGRLARYCRKYLRASKTAINPVAKGCLIAGGVLLIISGVGVGAYFLGKNLTPGGGGDDGLVKLTFDAMSTDEHPAYFNDDPTLTRLEVKVGKGMTFGEAKKLASNLTRVDHIDPVTKEPCVYDTIDKWSDATSTIADDRILDSDLSVTANYKPEQVKVIVDAGGNTWAAIKDDSTATSFSSIRRSITLTVDKGTTLKQALTISDGKLYEPSAIKKGTTAGTFEYDTSMNFTFLRDSINQYDIYPDDPGHQGKRTYDDYIIDKNVVLTANYSGIPGGGESAMTMLNVTFYASNPLSQDGTDLFRTGAFPDNTSKANTSASQTEISKTIGFKAEYGDLKSFKYICEIASEDGLKTPSGKYGTFKYWTDINGNNLNPEDDTPKYDIDFAVFAYYQPNFATDSWSMIKNVAEGGKATIKNAYGLNNDNDIYNLEKNIEIDNATYTVRVIGINVDYQELYEKDDPYENSSGEDVYIFAKDPAAMTLQFTTPYGEAVEWGNNLPSNDSINRNYLYQEDGCKIKEKLTELTGKLPSDLSHVINTTAKLVNYTDSNRSSPAKLDRFYGEDYSIESKLFLIGGEPEVLAVPDTDDHYSQYLFAFNESAQSETDMITLLDTSYHNVYGMAEKDIADFKPYWSRWNTFYPEDEWTGDYQKYRPNYWLSYFDIKSDSYSSTPQFSDCEIGYAAGEAYPYIYTPCFEQHFICPAFSIGNGAL